MNIDGLRQEYDNEVLHREDVADNPFTQFERWWQEIIQQEIFQPNAMTLATATANGRPSARTVLLKEMTTEGFVFYTNYHSRKGAELAQNPHACLLFYWRQFHRQVRVEGTITTVASETSDAYFASRPRGSQLGAWASPQSQSLENREELEGKLTAVTNQYTNQTIPRPPHWGGYILLPNYFEFWQGQPSRLHDRLSYTLTKDSNWRIERLAP